MPSMANAGKSTCICVMSTAASVLRNTFGLNC
jgi:hypothetical protein